MKTMLTICKCNRIKTSKVVFKIDYKGKCCSKCGMKYQFVEQSVIGVRVKLEMGEWDDGAWISLSELKKLLEEL